MAITLDSIETGQSNEPPRILIYGPGGIGKSSWAAAAPNPIFIFTEKGKGRLKVSSFPLARRFEDVTDSLACLATEDHNYQTIVLDTVDWLETLIHEKLCRDQGKDGIEDFGYGKGYVKALPYWTEIFSALDYLHDERGMAVILVGHSIVKTFNSPDTENYDQYQLKLDKHASAKSVEWCDAMLFANYEVKVKKVDEGFDKGKGKAARMPKVPRLLHTEMRPAFIAKNRYSLPPTLPLSWAAFQEAMAVGIEEVEEQHEELEAEGATEETAGEETTEQSSQDGAFEQGAEAAA